MPNPFFIEKIPETADYYLPPIFLNENLGDIEGLTDRIQVVDRRFNEVLPPLTSSVQFGTSIFEIEDKIESRPISPVLCSTSIFKSCFRASNEERWRGYIQELQDKIEYFETTPFQQLRVYVGNSMWSDLDKAGVLKSKNVDFIKMKESSTGWNIANVWRVMALTDYSYDYVYFDDVHVQAPQRICRVTFEIIQGVFADTDVSIVSALVTPPTQYHTFLIVLPFDFISDIKHHFYQPILQIVPIDAFLKTMIFDWYRGPRELPSMNLPFILLSCLNQHPLTEVYDPELNGWTYLQPLVQTYQDGDISEKIMFYLSKLVKSRLWFFDEDFSWYLEGYKKSGDDFFWKRLIEDINCDLKMGRDCGHDDFEWAGLEDYVGKGI